MKIKHTEILDMMDDVKNRALAGHKLLLADEPVQLSVGVYDETASEHLLISLPDLRKSASRLDDNLKQLIFAAFQSQEGKEKLFSIILAGASDDQ